MTLIKRVPAPTIERLALYLLCLKPLLHKAVETVSSDDIARLVGRNAAQVRKDLSYLGQFGTPGVGYNVAQLRERLAFAMGLKTERKLIVLGAGSLGSALCRYRGFLEEGFNICAAFDNDPAKVGRRIGRVTVQHISELMDANRQLKAHMALIAVPASAAQDVADLLAKAGISSMVIFAPGPIEVPPNVLVRRVDLTKELAVLSCLISLSEEVADVP
jgi:redox-sensing transcriptional repressor